jgi:hypothetical protein
MAVANTSEERERGKDEHAKSARTVRSLSDGPGRGLFGRIAPFTLVEKGVSESPTWRSLALHSLDAMRESLTALHDGVSFRSSGVRKPINRRARLSFVPKYYLPVGEEAEFCSH